MLVETNILHLAIASIAPITGQSLILRRVPLVSMFMKTMIELPLLPLRDVVVYPHMVIPLFVGRPKSIKALEAAMLEDKQILLVAQKSPADDDPDLDAVHGHGTVASILQLLKLPDGTVKVLAEGKFRGRIHASLGEDNGYWQVQAEVDAEPTVLAEVENTVLRRVLLDQFDEYAKQGRKVPAEFVSSLADVEEVARLSDLIAAQMSLKLEQKLTPTRCTNLSSLMKRMENKKHSHWDIFLIRHGHSSVLIPA